MSCGASALRVLHLLLGCDRYVKVLDVSDETARVLGPPGVAPCVRRLTAGRVRRYHRRRAACSLVGLLCVRAGGNFLVSSSLLFLWCLAWRFPPAFAR